jgi:hypothetical protein
MSDHTPHLPARPSLEQLRKQAKELLRDFRAGDRAAAERFREHAPRLSDPEQSPSVALADAQFVLAREYGFESWARLVHGVLALQPSGKLELFESLAQDLAAAYMSGNAAAIREINMLNGSSFVWDHNPEDMQRRLKTWSASGSRSADLALDDARQMVAGAFGFESWANFAESTAQPHNDPRTDPLGMSSTPPFYKIDWKQNEITLRGPLSEKDWDVIFEVIKETGITGLNAGGQMTDAAMKRLSKLDQVSRLSLEGCVRVSDDGLLNLANMPQLNELNLSGWHSPITDRGLQVLRHLTELRKFQMCWPQRITDSGVANLTFCEQLESVDLLGTHTGDGAIKALTRKPKLRNFKTGKLVTDAGLPLLHQFPIFKTWHGGEIKYSLMSAGAEPNHLLVDGSFTDQGFASIAGLAGLFALTFFWHVSAMKARGLAPLADLPNLGFLGCQNELCNDEAMQHIASIPRLRMLMGQGTVASDDGFSALSRSRTIEYIWGRECPNLGSRGFAALARMPSLKGLAVSCKNVDDAALSELPRFPSLTGLMPMDFRDAGFRHIGRCENLEHLWCMYCPQTGDAATEHISGLPRLRTYYAGGTQITDRSLETLSSMTSLESIELFDCAGITDAGFALLASLPRLREVRTSGSRITRECARAFPAHVRVELEG